jgi:HTH-type transcriptional regulator/antitoxin HigA
MKKDFESLSTPGDEIRKLLRDRNWTQADLAKVLGRPIQTINQIIQNKKSITPEMAIVLGAAFGTGAEKWMQLESAYKLSLVNLNSDPVGRRAKLYTYAPINEMQRRLWIKKVDTVEEQEKTICQFFEIGSLNEEPDINVAARASIQSSALTISQKAWCFRAKHLARAIHVQPFDTTKSQRGIPQLRELAAYPEEARHIPKILGDYGIRLLIIEPLSDSRIDGAALWFDAKSPVIVLSMRYDRIDAFWFTLMHELSHILHGDVSFDDALFYEGEQMPSIAKEDIERRADEEASAFLVPPDKLNSFILRVGPLYSKARINQFANKLRIHPGIIVGQLQHRGEIGYSANREMLVKVREIIANAAVTDGWGRMVAL